MIAVPNLNQVSFLVKTLKGAHSRKSEHIKQIYNNFYINFDCVCDFAVALNFIAIQGNTFELKDSLMPDDGLKDCIISRLLGGWSVYSRQLYDYLQKFTIDSRSNTLAYKPKLHFKGNYSGIRNLAIDIGLLDTKQNDTLYFVPLSHVHKCIDFLQLNAPIRTIDSLRKQLAANETIGLLAEQEVLSYEKSRLGKSQEDCVSHVSLTNTSLGYDIKSITIGLRKKDCLPRLIEVKAVPHGSTRFYWTNNEMSVAKKYRSYYYLYLVPFSSSGSLGIQNLEIIADPYYQIFNPEDQWQVDIDIACCERQYLSR